MASAGEVIDDRFVLVEPLGSGTFASVWKANDLHDGERPVALKLLFDHHSSDDKKLKRFVQEARILERLSHPNVAQAIAWSADPKCAYLALELIDGETLDEKIRSHSERGSPLPREGAAWICDQLCAAMSYAHAETIVHRDLKPKNVMISRRGQRPFLKVLDFGIAKVLLGSELDPTTVGKVLGSVLYISPEQVMAKPIDHRADIFALGSIAFEVITLHRAWARASEGDPLPFHGSLETGERNSHIAVLRRIARDERPRATDLRPDLSPAIDDVLQRALAVNPADRYESASELAAALRMALLAPGSAAELDAGLDPTEPTVVPDPAEARPARPRALPKFKKVEKTIAAEAPTTPDQPAREPAPLAEPEPEPEPARIPAKGPSTIAIFGALFFIAAAAIFAVAYLLLGH